MNLLRPYLSMTFIVGGICLCSCKHQHKHGEEEILSALKVYDRLVYKMDADSIAQMYRADGELGNAAPDGRLDRLVASRDSIRQFLSMFTNVKVLESHTASDSISIDKDTARQEGHYYQQVLMDHDTLNARGQYRAIWIWSKDDGWKIKTMITRPAQ